MKMPSESDLMWLAVISIIGIIIINPTVVPFIDGGGDSIQQVDIPENEFTANENEDYTTPQERVVTGPTKFDIDVVKNTSSQCGLANKDYCVTATAIITNEGKNASRGTYVDLKVMAGDRTLYQDSQQVGSLAPKESYSTTEEVTAGPMDQIAVKSNNCSYDFVFIVHYNEGLSKEKSNTENVPKDVCSIF